MNKTATRHAEAMFMRLNPPGATMEMDKLGTWVGLAPGLVVDGGNKHMHGVNSGVRFNQAQAPGQARGHGVSGGGKAAAAAASMTVEMLDAGVVVFGEPTGFPTIGLYGNDEPDLGKGVSSMLLNNLWGTNYVMWSVILWPPTLTRARGCGRALPTHASLFCCWYGETRGRGGGWRMEDGGTINAAPGGRAKSACVRARHGRGTWRGANAFGCVAQASVRADYVLTVC